MSLAFIALAVILISIGSYFSKIPKNLIGLKDDSIVLISQEVEILFCEIESIFPRRTTIRGIAYTYGTLVINTKRGVSFEESPVADVEEVAGILTGEWIASISKAE